MRRLVQEIDETCCPPVLRAALDPDDAERLAAALGILAEPARLRLLSIIAATPDQEACVCNLTEPLGLSQPTVSHHLRVLLDSGLLERTQRGRWAFYRLVPERLALLRGVFEVSSGTEGSSRRRSLVSSTT